MVPRQKLDWVDRLAGVENLDVTELLKGEWVLYPIGPWPVWPKWRRLVDLARARILGNLVAAVTAVVYRVRHNPANAWVEDDEDGTVVLPMGVIFQSYRSMYGIHHNYCAACDRPEHVHDPSIPLEA